MKKQIRYVVRKAVEYHGTRGTYFYPWLVVRVAPGVPQAVVKKCVTRDAGRRWARWANGVLAGTDHRATDPLKLGEAE